MPSPSSYSPWPAKTAEPSSSSLLKTQRDRADRRKRSSNLRRQNLVPDKAAITAAEYYCQVLASNSDLSCYPNSTTTINQHEWATFVWNSRLPQYAQNEEVNIYLFHGDSNQQIMNWTNYPNPTELAGTITANVNDTWFGTRGANWNGQNVPFLFYWVITPNNQELGNSYIPQETFTAVQTTYADSVLSSMQLTSSAPFPISTGTSGTSGISGTSSSLGPGGTTGDPSATGNVQNSSSHSGLAAWAIAVIVVLGFLAILATCVLVFLIVRRSRRRQGADLAYRGSMGSSTPMMAESNANAAPHSPLLGAGPGFVAGGAMAAAGAPSSSEHHDGASIISRANSAGDSGLFSGADAAIMADAFRKALRKPDFAGAPPDEESPEEKQRKDVEMMRELAEEGRDIRSVGSSRGVHVETLSDGGETAQDSAH